MTSDAPAYRAIECDLQFVELSALKAHGRVPRQGTDAHFRHPLTGEGNNCLARDLRTFDRDSTCFVFVSHRWLNPGTGPEGHPDNKNNDKLQLVVASCEAMKKALLQDHFTVAVWIDFACVNQDERPTWQFLQLLNDVMMVCDVMLTPVFDPNHESWAVPTQWTDCFDQYLAEEWTNYWRRGWCRIEALLAAVTPFCSGEDVKARAQLFRPGALRNAIGQGNRPHMIFGTKEMQARRAPLFLPPLLHTHLHKYPPEEGDINVSEDRRVITDLVEKARSNIKSAQDSYEGQVDAEGQAHGAGRKTWSSGKVYEGEFQASKMHGEGSCMYPFWDVYEGQWEDGARHGTGTHCYANGDMYAGQWRNNRKHGNGRFIFASGEMEEGRYADGVFMPIVAVGRQKSGESASSSFSRRQSRAEFDGA